MIAEASSRLQLPTLCMGRIRACFPQVRLVSTSVVLELQPEGSLIAGTFVEV